MWMNWACSFLQLFRILSSVRSLALLQYNSPLFHLNTCAYTVSYKLINDKYIFVCASICSIHNFNHFQSCEVFFSNFTYDWSAKPEAQSCKPPVPFLFRRITFVVLTSFSFLCACAVLCLLAIGEIHHAAAVVVFGYIASILTGSPPALLGFHFNF